MSLLSLCDNVFQLVPTNAASTIDVHMAGDVSSVRDMNIFT